MLAEELQCYVDVYVDSKVIGQPEPLGLRLRRATGGTYIEDYARSVRGIYIENYVISPIVNQSENLNTPIPNAEGDDYDEAPTLVPEVELNVHEAMQMFSNSVKTSVLGTYIEDYERVVIGTYIEGYTSKGLVRGIYIEDYIPESLSVGTSEVIPTTLEESIRGIYIEDYIIIKSSFSVKGIYIEDYFSTRKSRESEVNSEGSSFGESNASVVVGDRNFEDRKGIYIEDCNLPKRLVKGTYIEDYTAVTEQKQIYGTYLEDYVIITEQKQIYGTYLEDYLKVLSDSPSRVTSMENPIRGIYIEDYLSVITQENILETGSISKAIPSKSVTGIYIEDYTPTTLGVSVTLDKPSSMEVTRGIFIEDYVNTTVNLLKPEPIVNSTPVQVAEEKPKKVYATLRDLIRDNPSCEMSLALEYFSEKEINKQVMLGKVYKRKGKLII